MDIWHYSSATAELLGHGTADPDPTTPGQFLRPAWTTPTAPSADEAGKKQVFVNNAWSMVADHRGETWWGADGKPVVITELGDPPEGLTNVEPPAPPPPPVQATPHQLFTALAQAVGKTPAEIDALMALAKTL
jgi:hypothetical protein